MDRKQTIQNLQKALSMELTVAHQYQLNAAWLVDWGMDKLAAKMRQEMQEEIGHSDAFVNRIMFLKGTPRIVLEKEPVLPTSLVEMFQSDLKSEIEAISFYANAAKHAGENGDIGSKMLFEQTVVDEEGHQAWLELQLELLKRMGEANYISKHTSDGTAAEAGA